jgi:2,3-bisphosphoglycerate-dependent phosphoglycerate mutase
MIQLVLVRHGQSEFNRRHRFSGWAPVQLSAKGVAESERAGRSLAARGYRFDVCFTSVLDRGVAAAEAVLRGLGAEDLPLEKSWRLNERHFGALEGVGRVEAVRRYGLLRVLRLQQSYVDSPPKLDDDDPRHPGRDPAYAELDEKEVPNGESLRDTYARVLPCWQEQIVPWLRAREAVLIVGHKNSLRVLAKHIEGLSDEAVPKLRLDTGNPLLYQFNDDLSLRSQAFLEPQRKYNRWAGLSPA